MSTLTFVDTHNMFGATAKAKTVNGERQFQALIDKKNVIITETSIRIDLHLKDAGGTDCLTTATIFEELALMGAKTTAWNEFSSTMASAIICLATIQKFNFSKYIFDAMVLDLEKAKDAQAKEIVDLKKRVLKLERKKKSRPTGLKRLRKVGMSRRVESSEDKDSLGDHEDASKQGRSIEDIDKDADEREVNTNVEDSVAPTTIEEITLAQTLIQIKAAKPKVVTTAATTTTTTRPKAKGVVVQEPSEFRTPQESQPSNIKDKDKAIMIEPEVPLKRKDQVALDEDLARKLQA
ncbi:hypothetical protein Tco_0903394 [Tanacetum coccineum]